jgi:hypothetical protein
VQSHRQRRDLEKQLEQPFEHEEKLAAATERQQEIVTSLDITKNQASSDVGDATESNSQQIQGEASVGPTRVAV